MTDAATLLALAERCEREEPGCELNDAIAFAVGWRLNETIWWNPPDGDWSLEVPRYTTSLDAAVTLVPEGWIWQGGERYEDEKVGGWARVFPRGAMNRGTGNRDAKTSALALCAAALRACVAMTKEEKPT